MAKLVELIDQFQSKYPTSSTTDPSQNSEVNARTKRPAAALANEDTFAKRLKKICDENQDRIITALRGRRTLSKAEAYGKGRVFEYPPSSGLYCILACSECRHGDEEFGYYAKSNPVNNEWSANAAQAHFISFREHRDPNMAMSIDKMLESHTYIVAGTSQSWIKENNVAVRENNAQGKRTEGQQKKAVTSSAGGSNTHARSTAGKPAATPAYSLPVRPSPGPNTAAPVPGRSVSDAALSPLHPTCTPATATSSTSDFELFKSRCCSDTLTKKRKLDYDSESDLEDDHRPISKGNTRLRESDKVHDTSSPALQRFQGLVARRGGGSSGGSSGRGPKGGAHCSSMTA